MKRAIEFTIIFPSAIFIVYLIVDFVKHRLESKYQKRELRSLSLEAQLSLARLETLQAKMNPHFLYNSLNTIAGLATVDGARTREMATELSKYLRFNLDQNTGNIATVSEEIESVESYLKIEKIRFQETLNYEINVAEETKQLSVPRFLLQPIIENAVKHGMRKEDHSLIIILNIFQDLNDLIIEVVDNGEPFTTAMVPGFGLKSVIDKLELLFPNRHELEFITDPRKMVRVTIRLE